MPGHGAQIRYPPGTNVNTPFFQVLTLEFGHGAGARVQGLDLVFKEFQRATTSPIMHFIYPTKFCITFVFHFSSVLQENHKKVSAWYSGTKVDTGSLCAHNFCKFRAVHRFVLAAKLMFENGV